MVVQIVRDMKITGLYIQLLMLFCVSLHAQHNQVSGTDIDDAYIAEMKLENSGLSGRIKQQPAAFQELNKQAGQAIKSKDYSQALTVALEMEKQYPANADVHNFKGKMQSATGNNSAAVLSFSKAIQLEPGNKWFYINKATAQAESGKLQDALQTIKDLNSRYPGWSIGYNFKAALLHTLNKNEEALLAYKEAISSEPKSAQIMANRGDLYLQLGDKAKALQDYNAALAIQPDYSRAKLKINDLTQLATSKTE